MFKEVARWGFVVVLVVALGCGQAIPPAAPVEPEPTVEVEGDEPVTVQLGDRVVLVCSERRLWRKRQKIKHKCKVVRVNRKR